MNTLTLAKSDENATPRSRSPSPAHRSQINNNRANNRQGRPRQRPSILKRLTFQGFRQYPGNVRPSSLSPHETLFLTLGSDLSPDLDLDLDLVQI